MKSKSRQALQLKPKTFNAGQLLYRSLGLLVFLILWEVAPRLGWVRETYLPPPSKVFPNLLDLAIQGKLHPHVLISLQRIFLGLLLATLIGVSLGLLIGYFRRLNLVLDLLFQTFRQMSAFALFPVFILFFGLGEPSKIIIILWASLWPVLLNTSAGVQEVDSVLIRSVTSMGANKRYIFFRVILPAAAPQIFTGIRLSGSYCVMAVVAAEMIGATRGLGYLVLYSEQVFQVTTMYGAIIGLAILGIGLNFLLVAIEKHFTSWKTR
jgi:NitT/TauT family transport system permease protein